MKLRHISVLNRGLPGPSANETEADAEAADTPEDTLSLLLEFSESTKGAAKGLSGREVVVGMGEGAGAGVAEVPKVPKAPKAPKDVGPFIVMSKNRYPIKRGKTQKQRENVKCDSALLSYAPGLLNPVRFW